MLGTIPRDLVEAGNHGIVSACNLWLYHHSNFTVGYNFLAHFFEIAMRHPGFPSRYMCPGLYQCHGQMAEIMVKYYMYLLSLMTVCEYRHNDQQSQIVQAITVTVSQTHCEFTESTNISDCILNSLLPLSLDLLGVRKYLLNVACLAMSDLLQP